MNRHVPKPQLTRYESDYALWCAEQGALLRQGDLTAIDRENVSEEIESLGRSDRREIENRLSVLLLHLLKWRAQPDMRSANRKGTIREQRVRIARLLRESPSLASYPGEVFSDEYELARQNAADETGLPLRIFPKASPFSVSQALDRDFLPE